MRQRRPAPIRPDRETSASTNARWRRRGWLGAAWFLAAAWPAAGVFAQQGPVVTGNGAPPSDHAISVYVSNDALQALYGRDIEINRVGNTQARMGFFFNEERDLIAIGDLMAYTGNVQDPRNRRLEFRVGSRVYGAFLNVENNDVFSISIGGEAQWYFSRDRRTSVLLGFYYAPDILTFGEANNVTDATLRLQTRLTPRTDVFVGYRTFEFDQDEGDREVDDGVHLGFHFQF